MTQKNSNAPRTTTRQPRITNHEPPKPKAIEDLEAIPDDVEVEVVVVVPLEYTLRDFISNCHGVRISQSICCAETSDLEEPSRHWQ